MLPSGVVAGPLLVADAGLRNVVDEIVVLEIAQGSVQVGSIHR